MSITALLLAFFFWHVVIPSRHPWGILESNISQTTASSAASIISGGLVAPIPALALVTGVVLAPAPLIAWVFAVSFFGVWVAWYLRVPLLFRSQLPYPAGRVTAETMMELFARGEAALGRIRLMLSAAIFSALVKLVDSLVWVVPRWSPGPVAGKLTFVFDPSLLLIGFGAIIGFRAGLSLLLGALVGWGVISPWLLANGQVVVASDDASYFLPLVEWLLWPGVALMVTATLASLLAALLQRRQQQAHHLPAPAADGYRITRLLVMACACLLVVLLEILVMGIEPIPALASLPMAFFLAAVVGRVVGETGIPPIGATGKLSQLGFAAIAPGQAATNLLTANVAGGAAGQCADLLNDFKAGSMIGANPRRQVVAQCVGIATGSVVGSWVYLLLIPDPKALLLTEQWPAPAVATWAAVAEMLTAGFDSLPASALTAMLVASVIGLVLGIAEVILPNHLRRWLPSASAIGLAFVIPASTSLGLFYGALLAAILSQLLKTWSARFLVVMAAGLVAGESLMGVAVALLNMLDS
jgi:uncharacterized oligopeptide transporter (OPT) family protein